MAYQDYVTELKGSIPNLSYPLAQTLVNRAWRDILDMRLWSFLVGYADINAPGILSATGTASTTLGSPLVTFDATATAALAPLVFANPPLASPTLGVGCQFRITNTNSGGPFYTIIAYQLVGGFGQATLDRNYDASTLTGQLFQIQKAYYAVPSSDFVKYFSIVNMATGYSIRGKKLYYTQSQLNAIDPQRGSNGGDAYIVSAWRDDANGNPVHEWYPNPTNAAVYNCYYQRRGLPLSPTQDLPASMPSSLLLARAYMHACDWAMKGVAQYPELGNVNWVQVKKQHRDDFEESRIQCIKVDDEIFPRVPFIQGSAFDFPLGGQFLQGHDISSLVPGGN